MNLADVKVELDGSVLVARLSGEIDLSNSQDIEQAIAVAMPNHASTLILDLAALEYIDSAGIQLLYRLREKLRIRGQGFRLVVPSHSPAMDALRLAGVIDQLNLSETLDDAQL